MSYNISNHTHKENTKIKTLLNITLTNALKHNLLKFSFKHFHAETIKNIIITLKVFYYSYLLHYLQNIQNGVSFKNK